MTRKNKRGIELSLSPEAITALKAKAQALGYRSKSALIEAWATGQINRDAIASIASIQESINELANKI